MKQTVILNSGFNHFMHNAEKSRYSLVTDMFFDATMNYHLQKTLCKVFSDPYFPV